MLQALKSNELFQARFAQRWHHLTNPHVRALAWLLDAPDLLDTHAAQWQGKIATLGVDCADQATPWLAALNADPRELHAYLGKMPYTRLGRYAEKLMAFYFAHQGILAAHGLQVQAGKNSTIGEFDFLLNASHGLLHWEFATKFYLLEASGAGQQADYFVGPNLADTLGAKMQKILSRQLALASHPAAQAYLPQPVSSAQALVKGWLFYHRNDAVAAAETGLDADHCRGFWCALGEFDLPMLQPCVVLQRLEWLAPAQLMPQQAITAQALRTHLHGHFAQDTMPVMVALLAPLGEYLVETARGFIVPDDWRQRAGERITGRPA
jgi:hypothetical protein